MMEFFKRFTGISPFLVALLLSRFIFFFFTSSSVTALHSNISGAESFYEFAIYAILRILCGFGNELIYYSN